MNTDLENAMVLPQPRIYSEPVDPAPEQMCSECAVELPAEGDEDCKCVKCLVKDYLKHPEDFDEAADSGWLDRTADLRRVRSLVAKERVAMLAAGQSVYTTPADKAAAIIARESTAAALRGDAEVAEALLRAALNIRRAA